MLPMEHAGGMQQVSVESSWLLANGALESCVNAVFLDPATREPMFPTSALDSSPVVLVPPLDSFPPCEIIVKFKKNLCHVESFYTSSTARICELYSCLGPGMDAEYVCTLRCWESATDVDVGKGPSTNFLLDDEDGNLERITTDNSKATPRSAYSSGEGSWIEVKSNESLSVEVPIENLANARGLKVEDGEDGCCLLPSRKKSMGPFQVHESNVFSAHTTITDLVKVPELVSDNLRLNMYQAEAKLHDCYPWAALKVRFLSIQDKTQVRVHQIGLVVVKIPPSVTYQNPNQLPNGSGGSFALLNMLVPSMLQMLRGHKTKVFTSRRPPSSHEEVMKVQGSEVLKLHSVKGGPNDIDEIKLSAGNMAISTVHAYNEHENMMGNASGQVTEGTNHSLDLDTLLNTLLDRFDRLERLCMKIESHFHKTMEDFDTRLSFLENEYVNTVRTETESTVKQACDATSQLPSLSCTALPISKPCITSTETEIGTPTLESIDNPNRHQQMPECDCKDTTVNLGEVCAVGNHAYKDLEIKELKELNKSETVGNGSSTPPKENFAQKPCVSLDDAWASALHAFSCSSIPSSAPATQDMKCHHEERGPVSCAFNITTPMVPGNAQLALDLENSSTLSSSLEKSVDSEDLPWYCYYASTPSGVHSSEDVGGGSHDHACPLLHENDNLLSDVTHEEDSQVDGLVIDGYFSGAVYLGCSQPDGRWLEPSLPAEHKNLVNSIENESMHRDRSVDTSESSVLASSSKESNDGMLIQSNGDILIPDLPGDSLNVGGSAETPDVDAWHWSLDKLQLESSCLLDVKTELEENSRENGGLNLIKEYVQDPTTADGLMSLSQDFGPLQEENLSSFEMYMHDGCGEDLMTFSQGSDLFQDDGTSLLMYAHDMKCSEDLMTFSQDFGTSEDGSASSSSTYVLDAVHGVDLMTFSQDFGTFQENEKLIKI